MIFENPSRLPLDKMQELIGKKLHRTYDYGIITEISYSENIFGIIDGYNMSVDFGLTSNNKASSNRVFSYLYPERLEYFDLSKCALPSDFMEDINDGLKRIEMLEKENDEKLNATAKIPVTDRIKYHFEETKGNPIYRLYINLWPAFTGGCSALFCIGHEAGEVKLCLSPMLFNDWIGREMSLPLSQPEIADFFAHTRKHDKDGLDGISMSYWFYDGYVVRFYDCWQPDETEAEFELVKYIFRYFRKSFPDKDSQRGLDSIWEYF